MANSLPTPLLNLFEQRQPEAQLQRVWQSIRSRRDAKAHVRPWQRPRPILAVAFALAVVCVTLAIFLSRSVQRTAEHAMIVPSSIDASLASRRIDFGYGALMELALGGKLDVLDQSENSVLLALRRGNAHFAIRPGGHRRFRIESGQVSVEVVGTEFDVIRESNAVRVAVQRGRVLVRGPGVPDDVQALDAGRSLSVSVLPTPQASSEPIVTPEVTSAAAPSSKEAPSKGAASAIPNVAKSPTEDWRGAATRHEWNVAWQALGSEGLAREVAHTDDVADLLALADVARLTGHPNDALRPLRQIVGSHPEDPRSSMAAFTLGRVLLDSLGKPVQAAFAFEKAMSLKLPASLAEDALARLVEAHARSGAVVQARAAANSYRSRYPAGRRLADVNHWSPPE